MSGSGGLMQLVAYGAQDVYLTANPQVTFFKQLYRRHSNFAMESIEQTFNGVASFGKKVQCTVARNGDLISKVYLQATLPAVNANDISGSFNWIPFIGQYLIKSVEIEIGGQQIDKHYGDWLHIWNELTLPCGKTRDYLKMVSELGGVSLAAGAGDCGDGCVEDAQNNCEDELATAAAFGTDYVVCKGCDDLGSRTGCLPESTLYVPLEFWFNRHYGLALPLIALQYHEVKINVEFNDLKNLVNYTGTNGFLNTLNAAGLVSCSLWVDYIFLDTEERRRFAQVAHEYLIEQLQYTGDQSLVSTNNRVILSLNHPVKELIWVVQNPSYVSCPAGESCVQPYNYSDSNKKNPVAMAKLQLNGHDRFEEREGKYFNVVQPFQHHTASPQTGINVYSFAIRPEDIQPSGSCNFSRIDNAVLNLTLTSSAATLSSNLLKVYAVNYNVLRIMAGMGGLAYSN
jgi:hypothetical protein